MEIKIPGKETSIKKYIGYTLGGFAFVLLLLGGGYVHAQTCSCPSGYTLGKDLNGQDVCKTTNASAVVDNGTGPTVVNGSLNANYGGYGLVMYNPDYVSTPPTPTEYADVAIWRVDNGQFFASQWSNTYGRINNIGVTSSPSLTNQFLGFSVCIDAPSDGEYILVGNSDDEFEIFVDGEKISSTYLWYSSYGHSAAFRRYYARAIYLDQGAHILEFKYINYGGPGTLGAELVGPYPVGSLIDPATGIQRSAGEVYTAIFSAGTSNYTLERSGASVLAPDNRTSKVIWSTAQELGNTFDLGESVGLSCPEGYAVNTEVNSCGDMECVQIIQVDPTCQSTTCDSSGDALGTNACINGDSCTENGNLDCASGYCNPTTQVCANPPVVSCDTPGNNQSSNACVNGDSCPNGDVDCASGYCDVSGGSVCACDASDPVQDCDGDGNPNGTDPNPSVPTAVDDGVYTVLVGQTSSQNVLANDDFVPGSDTTIVAVGGTYQGTITTDPLTGTLDYTPTSGELGTTVTIDYEVCYDPGPSRVCDTATITYSVQCNPSDPVQDCDEDGNPNGTDPHPTLPTAMDDGMSAPLGTGTSVTIITNDDFIPDPAVTITDTGNGTAAGTVTIDQETGVLTYTPLESEASSTVTVIYEVCNTAPTPDVCDTATVTIIVDDICSDPNGDADSDGVINSIEQSYGDTDGDLVPNCLDHDDDNDGIYTITEGGETDDFDGDGLPNYLDLDSDNDGINDVSEAGMLDPDDDGIIGTGTPMVDADGVATATTTPTNTDGDAYPDFLDADSDDDGINDAIEGGNTDPDTDGYVGVGTPTTNANGQVTDPVGTVLSTSGPVDSDGDGSSDYQDLDSDNDGHGDTTDPNRVIPVAVDDAFTTLPNVRSVYDIISNDDFIAGQSLNIIDTGAGTAQGSVLFDANDGTIQYVAPNSEAGMTVTVVYSVCDTATMPYGCDTATITITVGKKSGSSSSVGSTIPFIIPDTTPPSTQESSQQPTHDAAPNIPDETPEQENAEPVLEDQEFEQEQEPTQEELLDEVIACAGTVATYRAQSSCYYEDGIFNASQWTDIAQSSYHEAIEFTTKQCYYHGRADTQQQFNPQDVATVAEVIKVSARLARVMPEGFNHFDADSEDRYRPYREALESHGLLDGVEVHEEDMYLPASQAFVTMSFVQAIEHVNGGLDSVGISDAVRPVSVIKTVSREKLALYTSIVHRALYGEERDDVPHDVQSCLDMIDTVDVESACSYQDGMFDGEQWSDINGLAYEDHIRNITHACLIHGAEDTQALYRPFDPAINAAVVKIAARMGLLMPEGFDHFAAPLWYSPYYALIDSKGLAVGTGLQDPQADVSLYDLVALYSRVYLLRGGMSDELETLMDRIPADYRSQSVDRGALAVITELFRRMMK